MWLKFDAAAVPLAGGDFALDQVNRFFFRRDAMTIYISRGRFTSDAVSCFCASQIYTITSIQAVATSTDPSFFAFSVYPCAFELALLLLGLCD